MKKIDLPGSDKFNSSFASITEQEFNYLMNDVPAGLLSVNNIGRLISKLDSLETDYGTAILKKSTRKDITEILKNILISIKKYKEIHNHE